jgi:hypothetical protein
VIDRVDLLLDLSLTLQHVLPLLRSAVHLVTSAPSRGRALNRENPSNHAPVPAQALLQQVDLVSRSHQFDMQGVR